MVRDVQYKRVNVTDFSQVILIYNFSSYLKSTKDICFYFSSSKDIVVREQVYSRGKLVLKASHWSRYVEGTLVNMKNVVGNFVTRTGTIHGGLKHVSYNISMETRLHLKSSLFPLICQYFLTKL